MKKIKVLMPAILAVGGLTTATPILASCNNTTTSSHIVEPSEEEKAKSTNDGSLEATYTLTFNEDVAQNDLTIELKNITQANENLIKYKSCTCADKKCDIVIVWNERPFGETVKCTFDLSITSTKGWTQDITGCSLTYNQPTTKFTVKFDGAEIEPQSIRYGDLATEPATPTKTDYEFAGWFEDSTHATRFDFNKTRILKDTTIYVKWIQSGKQVTSEQWDAAFAALADTREELNFWTGGRMVHDITYPNDEYWTGTLTDIAFNTDTETEPWTQRHYYKMNTKQKIGGIEEEVTTATGSEYCNNFYFNGTQNQSEGFLSVTYDVDYETPTTNFFYKVYNLAKGNFSQFTFNTETNQYDFTNPTAEYDCSVRFNADYKIQHLDFYSREVIAQGTIEKKTINSSFYYGEKTIEDFPEEFYERKAEAVCNWKGDDKICDGLTKSAKLNTGVIVPITISTTQQGCKNFKFIPTSFTKDFKTGDMAICVTRSATGTSEWEIFDKQYETSADGWKVQMLQDDPLVLGDKVEVLIKLQTGNCTFSGYMS